MEEEDSIFADDVELIDDATVLEEDYTPNKILCRDNSLDELTDILKPIYKGRPPQNAFLYGDTGVGKTAVTKYLRNRLINDLGEKTQISPTLINSNSTTSGLTVRTSLQQVTRHHHIKWQLALLIDSVSQVIESLEQGMPHRMYMTSCTQNWIHFLEQYS